MSVKIINVKGYDFKMVMTSETDGYFLTHRTYDLYFGSELIAKNVHSIKQCYNEAWDYSEKLEAVK